MNESLHPGLQTSEQNAVTSNKRGITSAGSVVFAPVVRLELHVERCFFSSLLHFLILLLSVQKDFSSVLEVIVK